MALTGTVDILESVSGSISSDNNISGNLSKTENVSGSVSSAPGKVEKDYNELINKPQIESVELVGNKTMKQLGVDTLSVQDIEKILYLEG